MFQTYVLAYLREDPRLKQDALAEGIALFASVKSKLLARKVYPLLSASIRCLTSPARYPDVVLASQGVINQFTPLDIIKGWKYNNTITVEIMNIASSVFLVLITSDEKYQGLNPERFAEVCVVIAEKIARKVTVDGEYWWIYRDLTNYTLRYETLTHTSVFISNVIRYLVDLKNPVRNGPEPTPLERADSPAPLAEVPEVTLGERHAVGAYGSIYSIDSNQGQRLAVKKQVMSEMVTQELSIMASCKSANIIDLQSFKLEGIMTYIFMPFGKALSEYATPLSKEKWETVYLQARTLTKLSRKLRRNYGRDVLTGLQYLHEHGIIHGDVKPSNIVVVDGVAKLIDFGLSVCYSFSKFDREIKSLEVYSLPYRPPEIIFLQDRRYSYSADVWAAGVTLVELETGVLPTIYGESPIMTNEMFMLKTTADVIGPPFDGSPYEHFPFMKQGRGSLEAIEDVRFRELAVSMLEWIPSDRASLPDLILSFEKLMLA